MSTHNKVVPLKVCIQKGGHTQMRRVRLYDPSVEVVVKVVNDWVCGGFTLNYIDDEGDEVLMESEEEWQECVYVARKQGNDVVKILVRCTGRTRSPSVSSVSSSSSVASTCTVSTTVTTAGIEKEEEEKEEVVHAEEVREEEVQDEVIEGDVLVPIDELLSTLDPEDPTLPSDTVPPLEEPTEEITPPEVPTPRISLPDIPAPEPFEIDTVPTPRCDDDDDDDDNEPQAEAPEPVPTAADFEPFRDYELSGKIETILRRLYGGSYVDMLVNGALTPEGLGCQDWLIASPSPVGCYFEILSADGIVNKLNSVGETQFEKHDYEGAALWFEMCTDLDVTSAKSWYNFAKAQALHGRVECINALAMAVGCGGDEVLSRAATERAFSGFAHLPEFKETIPFYEGDLEPLRKCAGCKLFLDRRSLPMQKFCCGRCRSHKRGHTANCKASAQATHPCTRPEAATTHPYRYHAEVLELTSMGFNDVERVKQLVEKYQGNIDACLLELLN